MKTTKLIGCLALVFGVTFHALPTAASPTIEWIEQLGTGSWEVDISEGVSTDGFGNVYMSGFTKGSLKGTNAGHSDAFVSKYDSSGTLLWTEQFGTDDDDNSTSVSADGMGNVYLSGRTWGSLEGTNLGGIDAFLVKINDPSYPVGDFDEDFDVDGADFLKWQRDLGEVASLAGWENNFGTVAASLASIMSADLSSGSTSSTVPEPNTLLLGALASAGLLLRRKR